MPSLLLTWLIVATDGLHLVPMIGEWLIFTLFVVIFDKHRKGADWSDALAVAILALLGALGGAIFWAVLHLGRGDGTRTAGGS